MQVSFCSLSLARPYARLNGRSVSQYRVGKVLEWDKSLESQLVKQDARVLALVSEGADDALHAKVARVKRAAEHLARQGGVAGSANDDDNNDDDGNGMIYCCVANDMTLRCRF